jgi:acyl dehydratase
LVGRNLGDFEFLVDDWTADTFLGLMGRAPGAEELPASFGQVVALAMVQRFDWDSDLMVDLSAGGTAVYGEQDLRFHALFHRGQRLQVTAAVDRVVAKHGGRRRFDAVTIRLDAMGSSLLTYWCAS